MDGKASNAIESILQQFDRQQQIMRREMERKRLEREAFLANFYEKVGTVFRPVMEQTGVLMVRGGHEYEILEQREGPCLNDRPTNALIKLTIFPNGERPRSSAQIGWPHVALIVNPGRNTILAHESAMMPNLGGPFGTAGEYALEALTGEVLEGHIIRVISRAMGPGRKVDRPAGRPRRAVRVEPRRTSTGEERLNSAFTYLSGPLD